MSCILLFGLGILIDVVWTLAVQAVETKKAWRAGAYQALFTLIATMSAWWIIVDQSIAGALAYAAGGGLGTAWVVMQSRR